MRKSKPEVWPPPPNPWYAEVLSHALTLVIVVPVLLLGVVVVMGLWSYIVPVLGFLAAVIIVLLVLGLMMGS